MTGGTWSRLCKAGQVPGDSIEGLDDETKVGLMLMLIDILQDLPNHFRSPRLRDNWLTAEFGQLCVM